ncbi:MAG TPA: hypothetical protein VFB21_24275 [Chthonomonadaceae bacterium]|nr:hypothetical protein [Chthonomonadaceae bacterium]
MYHPGVLRAALVSHQGQRLLAVELAPSAEAATLSELKETLAWACLSEIRVFPRIPVDRRHNAKIDYPALRRLLSGE